MPKGDTHRKLTEAQSRNLAERYATPLPDGSWRGAKALGRKFGITPTAVYYHLAKQGVTTRDRRTAASNGGKGHKPIRNLPVGAPPLCPCGCNQRTSWDQRRNRWYRYVAGHYLPHRAWHDAAWLQREYVEKGRSANDIARDVGVTHGTVLKRLELLGIPRRTASEAHIGLHRGAANPAWKGGVAEWDYSPEWKRIARLVRNRDAWTCQDCGERRKRWGHSLHVHHIDGDKLNDALENLVSLCATCHHRRHGMTRTVQVQPR
jgi:hypothetical protein